jgi:Protein kinase domain/PEGA domain
MNTGFARLGRYEPVSRLGQGSLLETLRARALEPVPGTEARDFTLKILRSDKRSPDLDERFLALVRRQRWTAIAGTVPVSEIGEGPGPVFAAFEFVEGVDLRQLRAQAVPQGSAMDARLVGLLGRKLAERLGPLHAQADGPRVHGSLSPGNILVKPSGDILLLDCGLSEALRDKSAWPSESWRYASPEQLRGEPSGQAADFYALGALMYFLCYGRPPFEADSPQALEARIAQGPPALDGLHPAVASYIARLLSYAIPARPKSASEIIRQISVALLSANAGVAMSTPASPTAPLATPTAAHDSLVAPGPDLSTVSADDPDVGVAQDEADETDEAAARPFVFVAPEARTPFRAGRGAIEADDPDVGVVYDDDDEEDEIEVAADGTVKRKRRRRSVRLLTWTRSEFARKVFRYAWIPIAVVLLVLGVEGFFFLKSWREVRAQSRMKDAAAAAEHARIEAAKPKLAAAQAVPAGHLVLKVSPPGAVVWLDGREVGTAPSTMLTEPGAHRLVLTAPGYRMLRDVIDTSNGMVFEREMVAAAFPLTGSVGLNVGCATEGKYPVLVDGREIGALCPIAGIRLDPGKHMVGIFVIPQNRIWTFDRDIVAEHPHRVQFNY